MYLYKEPAQGSEQLNPNKRVQIIRVWSSEITEIKKRATYFFFTGEALGLLLEKKNTYNQCQTFHASPHFRLFLGCSNCIIITSSLTAIPCKLNLCTPEVCFSLDNMKTIANPLITDYLKVLESLAFHWH